ncbi:MAG: universal stress protein [Planctomycetia bacterium]|nr:universal stress protein [Planctomycetia bacterium]
MIELKRILVPVDFDQPSEKALHYGTALAEAFGATVFVVHVTQAPMLATAPGTIPGYGSALADECDEAQRSAHARLQRFLGDEHSTAHGIVRLGFVRLGAPVAEIVHFAKEQGIDLIVMGTHGRGPVAHMLLGSSAEEVVRTAPLSRAHGPPRSA